METSVDSKRTTLILSYLIALLFILLPFHATLTVWLGSTFHHYTLFRLWDEVVLGIIAVGVLYVLWRYKRPELSGTRPHLLWGLSVMYILLHITLGGWALWSHRVNLVAAGDGLILNLRLLVVFWLCVIVASQNDWLHKHWRQVLLVPAAVVIAFGLLQHFVLPPNFLSHVGYSSQTIQPYETVDQKSAYIRVQSTLRGANPLGAYVVVIVAALGVLAVSARKYRWDIAAALFLSSIVLFFTYSRSAWVGSLIGLAIIGWLALKRTARQWLFLPLVLLVLLGTGSVVALRHNSRFENIFFHTDQHSHSPASSNQNHTTALRKGVSDIKHQPLGAGPGTAGPASVHNNKPGRVAENYYVQLGQEVGILGIGIFIAINVIIAEALLRRRHDPLALVMLASLLGISFINLLSHAWTDDTLGLLWWGLAGVAVAPVIIKTIPHETQTKEKTTV